MNLTLKQLKELEPLVKRREKITAELLKIEAQIKAITGEADAQG